VWRDAVVVGGKDLRVEYQSRVALMQVAPYSVIVLLLFGFAFDQNHTLLSEAAPGLFWVAVLLCSLLSVQRSYAIEAADGAKDGLRLSGLDPAGIFLGKAAAIAVQLVMLELVLGAGVVVLFGTTLRDPALLVLSALAATVGLAASGTVYGMVASGLRGRETLLPLLVLPIVAPVLLAATQCWMSALGSSPTDGWRWLALLGAFGAIYVALGILTFSTLVEDT
jgi:heme exporter protein B